jgi:hypothetical protein
MRKGDAPPLPASFPVVSTLHESTTGDIKMADKTHEQLKSVKVAERDVVRVEFLIDDLIKQLIKDPIAPVANCNGCSRCSAIADIPGSVQGR